MSKKNDLTAPIVTCARHRIQCDGQGVTTLVVFYGCPLRCRWCINPFTYDPAVKRTDMTPSSFTTVSKSMICTFWPPAAESPSAAANRCCIPIFLHSSGKSLRKAGIFVRKLLYPYRGKTWKKLPAASICFMWIARTRILKSIAATPAAIIS